VSAEFRFAPCRFHALSSVDAIADAAVGRFRPAWATRAHLLAGAGRADEAVGAYARAIALTTEPRLRRYLQRKSALLVI
jgi:RNA polymerase sigma-70 factor (ECF subfamily)